MAKTGRPDTQGSSANHQALESCPKNYKPWIWTLVLMALITLGWTVFENYQDGGVIKSFIESDDMGSSAGKMTGLYTGGAMSPAGNPGQSYHGIIDAVRPAVISIDADLGGQTNGGQGLFGANYTRVGSGVIIDPKGFVLSSLHVVAGAKALRASVYNPAGAKYYRLKVVNVNKDADLVLLRIREEGPFDYAVLGDSDATRTGDRVLAMGSPFGFDHTITTGIISSRNRTLNIGGRVFEGILQTDTPINRGNSGGPLVSLNGEVIGINTAIYSPTGSFSGIGFAIPVNMAKTLVAGVVSFKNNITQVAAGQIANWVRMGRQVGNTFKLPNGMVVIPPHGPRGICIECHPQLKHPLGLTPGQVQPGLPQQVGIQQVANTAPFIGATFLPVDPVIADQFNLLHAGGVLVDQVYPGTPAAEVGLQRGDIIMRVDGKRIRDVADFRTELGSRRIGSKIDLVVMSGNDRKTVSVRTAVAPPFMPRGPQMRQVKEFTWLGSEISPLNGTLAAYVKSGVMVRDADGVLRAAGVMKGDVIKGINNARVTDMMSFISITKSMNVNNGFLLDIVRGGQPLYITVRG